MTNFHCRFKLIGYNYNYFAMLFEIKNIKYEVNDTKIISEKSFKINDGQHLLIHGPSGCGKTTLINLLSGLLKPTSGDIAFENYIYSELNEVEIDNLRFSNFGFIFQKLHLIGHLNAKQNIQIASNNKNSLNVENLIQTLGLKAIENKMVKNLSFGESQRVAVARCLVNSPKVIFADEPTSGLDDSNAKIVIDLILKQAKKTESSLIVSTHDQRIKNFFSDVLEM